MNPFSKKWFTLKIYNVLKYATDMDVTYADDEQYFQWDNMYVGKHNSEPEKEAMGVQTNTNAIVALTLGILS